MNADTLLAELRARVGAQHLLTGDALQAYATDVFSARAMPLAMASPGSVDELQAVVRCAAGLGVALVPRGGGASYTAGYLPQHERTLLIDLRRLDRIVAIDATDAYVTVEAGVTWAALDAALAARGLRTPFRGPFSGSVATVGGAVSQHAISHGSAAHGVSADSVLSIDVVLADGSLLTTGSAARTGTPPFLRHFGPDLTGLFCGDCGAFGIKARVTLALMPLAPAHAGLSFGFDSFEALHAGMRATAWAAVGDTQFGLDAAALAGQAQREQGWRARIALAQRIWGRAPSPGAGLLQLARMALAGERGLRRYPFLAHYLIDGADAADARRRVAQLRRAIGPRGVAIGDSVPAVLHARPFEKLFQLLGPGGERWVPLHGVLPHSRVAACRRSLDDWFAAHADEMARRGVFKAELYQCLGRGGFTIEIGLYWPDALSPYHQLAMTAAEHAQNPSHPADVALRERVAAWRAELIVIFERHGAVHMQIGKTYRWLEPLGRPEVALALKRALDPAGLMNPGTLGLGEDGRVR